MSNMNLNKNNNMITFSTVALLSIFFLFAGIAPQSLAAEKSTAPAATKAAVKKEDPAKPAEKILSKELYSDYFLASLGISRGDYKKAKPYLEKVYKNDPQSLYLNKKMAVLLEKLGDFKGAARYARRCVDIDPSDLTSHMLAAELAAMIGDRDTEKKEYNAILTIDPAQQRVRFLLATALIKSNQLDEAMKQLEQLISENPFLSFAQYYKSRIYLEWGKYQEAEKGYLLTLELDETFEPALFDLASLYQSQKRLDEAIKLYKKLVGLYPSNRTAQERLMNLYSALGQKTSRSCLGTYKPSLNPAIPAGRLLESIISRTAGLQMPFQNLI